MTRHPSRYRRNATLAGGLVSMGLAAISGAVAKPLLIWNASPSAPLGLYRRSSTPIHASDWVLAWAPAAARRIASTRGYLPWTVPIVKRVAAVSDTVVCGNKRGLWIGARLIAKRLAQDRVGRSMPIWNECKRLTSNDYLLINHDERSFDSRYFGPVSSRLLIEKIVPLWTF